MKNTRKSSEASHRYIERASHSEAARPILCTICFCSAMFCSAMFYFDCWFISWWNLSREIVLTVIGLASLFGRSMYGFPAFGRGWRSFWRHVLFYRVRYLMIELCRHVSYCLLPCSVEVFFSACPCQLYNSTCYWTPISWEVRDSHFGSRYSFLRVFDCLVL